MPKPASDSVPALDRAIDIVELLAASPGPVAFSEILATLRIPRASLARILGVLRRRGLVDKLERDGRYRLGVRLLYLGHRFKAKIDLRSAAWPAMERLSKTIEETVELSTLDRDQLVLIEQIEGRNELRLFSRVGGAYPYFHATAPGKIYLAHMDPERRRARLGKIGMPAITTFTLTEAAALEREVETILERGYALEDQELRLGVIRVASPIYDHEGALAGCLSVAAPTPSWDRGTAERMAPKVAETCRAISRELGHR